MDKKLGIITFHNADNYGAILQAYATQEFLINNGFDATIIDYYHNNSSSSRPFILKFISSLKALFRTKTRRAFFKHLKCNNFRKKYLKRTKKYYGDESINSNPPIMDIYISGSDQILNFDLTANSYAFYLSFVKDGMKISYASSFGKSYLSTDEINAVKNHLSSFDALSFRENDGYTLASKYLVKHKKNIVLDPVFLLEKEEWQKLVFKCKHKTTKPYIFVYGVENNNLFLDLIKEVKKQYNLPMVGSFSSSFKCPSYIKDVTVSDPLVFLFWLSNASLVVTNSFHGTAFSIIFQKHFICADPLVRRSRIVEVLKKTNNSSSLISNLFPRVDLKDYEIDGSNSYKNLKSDISDSKHYLLGAVNND